MVYGKTPDGKDHHFVIPYSLWYWQFNVPKIWKRTEIGATYRVKYYRDLYESCICQKLVDI